MKYLLIITCLFMVGCSQSQSLSIEDEEPISPSINQYFYTVLEEEKRQVICDGDIPSYRLINTELPDGGNERDVLAYALIMANKYDDTWAHYTVYKILKGLGGCGDNCRDDKLNCLDDKTKNMALDYLMVAAKKGNEKAQREYDRLRSEGVIE